MELKHSLENLTRSSVFSPLLILQLLSLWSLLLILIKPQTSKLFTNHSIVQLKFLTGSFSFISCSILFSKVDKLALASIHMVDPKSVFCGFRCCFLCCSTSSPFVVAVALSMWDLPLILKPQELDHYLPISYVIFEMSASAFRLLLIILIVCQISYLLLVLQLLVI